MSYLSCLYSSPTTSSYQACSNFKRSDISTYSHTVLFLPSKIQQTFKCLIILRFYCIILLPSPQNTICPGWSSLLLTCVIIIGEQIIFVSRCKVYWSLLEVVEYLNKEYLNSTKRKAQWKFYLPLYIYIYIFKDEIANNTME